MSRGSTSSGQFGLQQSRSTEGAVDLSVAAPTQRSVGHPAEGGIAVTLAPIQNELPAVGNVNCGSYGATGDGGGGQTAGADWASFRAGQFQAALEAPWATGTGDATIAPTEHGAWFDAPLGDDGGDSVRPCTDLFGQAPGGPSGAAETRLIVNPIRPATPPRMRRLDHGRVERSSVGDHGNGPSGIDRMHSGFDRSGGVVARQNDRGWTGSDVGQEGGRGSECGATGAGDAASTESAQLGKTIAKKLDFHDVFLDPV